LRTETYMPMRQIHLDFHTSEVIEDIARDFDAEEFARTLKDARVDSINLFAKCHHGMLYYDTQSEARHPHLQCNLLDEQIEACHRYGIQTPIYISVGLDEFAAQRRPDWIEIGPDGRRSGAAPLQAGWRKMCLNNPEYLAYLQGQIEEVLDHFHPADGIWLDIISQGECCCKWCMRDMPANGFDPESGADRRRFASGILDTLKSRMSAIIRAKNPNALIFWNAGHVGPYIRSSLSSYTHLDLESLPSGGWSYDHFPMTARYARNLGMEFTGMTGKFLKSWADFGGFKNPAALEYECFTALALCGGCGVGDQLHPHGKITKATYDLIGGVLGKVQAVEPWCAKASAVTEIGVINPEVVSPGAAGHLNEVSAGIHRMLKETHYQYDFIDFEMDLSRYKVVVLPDIIRLNDNQASLLNEYVRSGGKILASYQSGMGQDGYGFGLDGMPVRALGDAEYSPDYLAAEEVIADGIPSSEHVMYEGGLKLELLSGAKALAQVWNPFFNRTYAHFCSHAHTPADKPAGYPGIAANESIVYAGYPIFGMYKRHGAKVYRDMMINSLKLLLPDDDRLVSANLPSAADVMLNYQADEDRYVLHVLHYVPEKRYGIETIEDVIPLYEVQVSLNLPEGYNAVSEAPSGQQLSASVADGRLRIIIPRVNGYAVIGIGR